MGQTAGQKTASKYTKQGVATLQGAQNDMLSNPTYLAGQNLALSLMQNPLSFSDSVKQMIEAAGIGQAQQSYQSGLQDTWEKAGASGGYRSGFTRGQEMRLAQGMGEQKGNIVRQVESDAAKQRPIDIANAMSVGSNALSQKYHFQENIANMLSGAAANPLWQQPSVGGQVGSGLGSLLGTGLSAQGMSKGLGGQGLFK